MEKVTNINQAINVLIQAADLAQKRGAYTLADASAISDAKDFILALSKSVQEAKGQEANEAQTEPKQDKDKETVEPEQDKDKETVE